MEPIPPELFLDAFPGPIQALAHRLREVLRDAVPDAAERVRPGWHLIGYDAPRHAGDGRGKAAYFAYIAPERQHIHLGFEHGHLMRDPDRRLEGEGITRQVRWLRFVAGDDPDPAIAVPLLREARRVALLSRAERFEAAMVAKSTSGRSAGPDVPPDTMTGATRGPLPSESRNSVDRHTSMRLIR